MGKSKSQKEDIDIIAEEIRKAVLAQSRKTYTPRVVELSLKPRNMGALPDADGFGFIRGICGDTMQIYLQIARGRVKAVKYRTDGCGPTIACGEALAGMVKGKSVRKLMGISPADLLADLGGLPKSHLHCAILAVNTLHSAVAKYLFARTEKPAPD